MSAIIFTLPKITPARRLLVIISLLVILGISTTAGFVYMQMDQVIAPPSLRILDWLWKVFVCRCPV